ncbi:MAG: anti-sigma factor [Fidelibacterota bacterium]|nr:MAG: anti-sigma factor [Candidatus Neomarinimicrobiota bacterium]
MSSCSRCQKMMAGALYQELAPHHQQAFDAHLATCPNCAEEYQQLLWTLNIMDQRQPPAIDPAYWEGFWNRLSDRLKPDRRKVFRPDWRRWFPPVTLPVRPAWVSVAAAVLLIATGVYIGRSIYLGQPNGPAAVTRAEVLDPAVIAEFNGMLSHYLGQSRSLLLGLENFDTGYDDPALLDFPRQQMMSWELLVQGQEIKRHAVASSDPRLQHLVNEIERVLLQLANSEGEDLEWTIRLVQEGVEQNAILVKINLTEQEQGEEVIEESKSLQGVKKSALWI